MPNRYICEVLEEMRTCLTTHNFSYLPGLIEEAQTMASRMEAHIRESKSLDWYHEQKRDLKKEIKELEQKKQGIEDGK